MLIGIDASRALRSLRTGTERYSLEIIRHLLALPEASVHRWRLYVDREAPPELFRKAEQVRQPAQRVPNVEICLLPARTMWTHRALAKEISTNPPDLLFVPSHVLPFTWSRQPPTVVTIHDLGYHYYPQTHTRRQRLYLRLTNYWHVKSAARLLCISQATADDLSKIYSRESLGHKIRVIHEGHPTPVLASSADQKRIEQRYRLPRPYALYVGTIQPRKNLARLIQAYAHLLAQDDELGWDLVLAGNPGWLSQSLYDLAQSLDVEERIHFVGYVPDEDLPALLRGATFFCYPSLFEGFGLPILEAQSYGVPVMTATNSSLPEVAGDAALFVDPTDIDSIADAMLRLSQDEALRQHLVEAGYINLKRFSWEKAAKETLAVFEELDPNK